MGRTWPAGYGADRRPPIPPDRSAGGVDLTPPMANRFLHIDFEPSPQGVVDRHAVPFRPRCPPRGLWLPMIFGRLRKGAVCAFIEARRNCYTVSRYR